MSSGRSFIKSLNVIDVSRLLAALTRSVRRFACLSSRLARRISGSQIGFFDCRSEVAGSDCDFCARMTPMPLRFGVSLRYPLAVDFSRMVFGCSAGTDL